MEAAMEAAMEEAMEEVMVEAMAGASQEGLEEDIPVMEALGESAEDLEAFPAAVEDVS